MNLNKPACPYCNNPSKLVKGDTVYPHRKDLHTLNFYVCKDCDARVGTHRGTITPLGRLANAQLRKLKSEAHSAFDPLWKQGIMSRSEAYGWLSENLDIEKKDCHIGMFDEETCRCVVILCRDKKQLRGVNE